MKLKSLLGIFCRGEAQRLLYRNEKTLTQSQTLAHSLTRTQSALVCITKEKLKGVSMSWPARNCEKRIERR